MIPKESIILEDHPLPRHGAVRPCVEKASIQYEADKIKKPNSGVVAGVVREVRCGGEAAKNSRYILLCN